jgi:hypothetical protein
MTLKREGVAVYMPYRQASIDRTDSSQGYTPDNIQFVSLMANYAKNAFQEDQLIDFCRAVAKKHPDPNCTVPVSEIQESLDAMDAIGFPG